MSDAKDIEADLEAIGESLDIDSQDETTPEEVVEDTTEESPASDALEESEQGEESEGSDETEPLPEATEEESEVEEAEVDPKEQARLQYQQRQQERLRRESQLEQMNNQELLAMQQQGADDEQIAIRQMQQVQYGMTVTNNTDRLQNQFDAAKTSIPYMNDPNPKIRDFMMAGVDEFEAMHVRFDQLGNPIQVSGNLTEYLQTKARQVDDLLRSGEVQGKKNTAKSKSAVTPRPSGTPPKAKVDPIVAAFLDEANK